MNSGSSKSSESETSGMVSESVYRVARSVVAVDKITGRTFSPLFLRMLSTDNNIPGDPWRFLFAKFADLTDDWSKHTINIGA
jgi:hypothetical protein